jgi:dihydrofolate reductase
MTTFRLYIAVSADGYIATPDGGVAWLDPFQQHDFGYREFMETIGTVILGRKTYDQALGFGDWPYPGKNAIVWTSRPLVSPPAGVEATSDLGARVARLRAEAEQDVCVVGGGQLIRALFDLQAIDELQLFTMPLLLGDGIPLFEKRPGGVVPLRLTELKQFPSGVAKLVYRPA